MRKRDGRGKQIRVAIVDDDESFLELASYNLKKDPAAKFEVTCFSKPMDLYDPQFVEGFDAYVVDYKLGQVDGIDLILGLRGRIHSGPFILCSGAPLDYAQRQRAVKAGIEIVIEKTSDVYEVLSRYILELTRSQNNKSPDP